MGFKPGDFPAAEQYYAQTLSLPMFSSMTRENIDHVVASLRDVLPGAAA
jgi:dTDP-4-amino-4,6-dideoxygalactose transaminase